MNLLAASDLNVSGALGVMLLIVLALAIIALFIWIVRR